MNPEDVRHVLTTGRCPRCFSEIQTTNMVCYACGMGWQSVWWNGRWWYPYDFPPDMAVPPVVDIYSNVYPVEANLAFAVD